MKKWVPGSVIALLLISAPPTNAQPTTNAICAAARSYFSSGDAPAGTELLLMSESLVKNAQWTALPPWASDTPFSRSAGAVYFAYFFSAPYVPYFGDTSEQAGAISIKISVATDVTSDRTSTIVLYRPPIQAGTNRCERRGRPAINGRHVGINEYIDYHNRTGNSSNIEDFHFRYPYGTTNCANTDRPEDVARTFQFDGLKPAPSDTIVARLFGNYIGSSYAMNANAFSHLQSELHYYNRTGVSSACVGFEVPVNRFGKSATIKIHDISSNWFSGRGSWSVHRQ
jgi:hypothetical protein